MTTIETEILIHASIEKIWAVLTNFPAYSEWNPFIRKVEGRLQVGEQLSVTVQPAGQKPMTFRPKVNTLGQYEFSWLGQVGMPGIFDGLHQFKLEQQSDGRIKLLHSEQFSGILSWPILCMIKKSTKEGFENMNQALKSFCE